MISGLAIAGAIALAAGWVAQAGAIEGARTVASGSAMFGTTMHDHH